MKVIIEIDNYVSLESTENPDEVVIVIERGTTNESFSTVKIDDLQLALHKLAAK